MYSVSNYYITAESKAVKQFKLRGKCCGKDFTDADILSGSFSVSNQCSPPSELSLGSVYVGQLQATFLPGLNIPRNSWVGGQITVSVGLKLASGRYEYVPVGVYTIAEAKHARSGVEVTAYDNMSLFDRQITFDTTYGTVYELLSAFCEECDATLGMTQAEVEALPNGSRTLGIYQDNDCDTYRDLLANLAAVCGCFATMDRTGQLVLRPFFGESVDSFDSTERFSGCKFSDYVTSYAGITVNDAEHGGTNTYTNGNEGVTLGLGNNPFMQYGIDETLEAIGSAAAASLKDVNYTPFEATLLVGAEYDLGDVLTMTDGTAGVESACIIHSIQWTFGKGCTVKGYGSNPEAGQAKSRYDKMISGMKGNSSNEIKYYVFQNVSRYEISDGSRLMLLFLSYATVKGGYIIFQCEIHADVSGEISFYYMLNDAELDFVPVETFTEDEDPHIINLFIPLFAEGNTTYDLELYAEMNGGSCVVEPGNLRAMLYGQGLAATDEWTGRIRLSDEMVPVILEDIGLSGMSASLSMSYMQPESSSFNDTFAGIALDDITMIRNIRDTIYTNRDMADRYTWNSFSSECDDWDDAEARFLWS